MAVDLQHHLSLPRQVHFGRHVHSNAAGLQVLEAGWAHSTCLQSVYLILNSLQDGSEAGGGGGGGDLFHHQQSQDGLPYSTMELTQPEYCTDDFRMFAFKARAASAS
jgi:hypothetical protein